MENTSLYYKEGYQLPTTKSDKQRSNSRSSSRSSSVPSIFFAFFSCLAWLYIAGRLFCTQAGFETCDPQTFGDIALAPLPIRPSWGGNYFYSKVMAGCREPNVVVQFAYEECRRDFQTRGSWMPKGDSLKKLEERGIVIRFVIGWSPNRGDSLDRNIDAENHSRIAASVDYSRIGTGPVRGADLEARRFRQDVVSVQLDEVANDETDIILDDMWSKHKDTDHLQWVDVLKEHGSRETKVMETDDVDVKKEVRDQLLTAYLD
ncbi:hydroxyproline O-galactosyltransferase HPGT3-like protein [Tanacetum coccineum]